MRFRFRPETARELAKELRRASWGIAAFGGGFYAKTGDAAYVVVAALGWAALQSAAFVADNLESDE